MLRTSNSIIHTISRQCQVRVDSVSTASSPVSTDLLLISNLAGEQLPMLIILHHVTVSSLEMSPENPQGNLQVFSHYFIRLNPGHWANNAACLPLPTHQCYITLFQNFLCMTSAISVPVLYQQISHWSPAKCMTRCYFIVLTHQNSL